MAVSFTSAAYITTEAISPGTRLTMSAWVIVTGDGFTRAICSPDDNALGRIAQFRKETDNTISFIVFTTGGAGSPGITKGTTDLSIGTWHHVVGVYDGTDVRCYVDGVQEGTPDNVTGNLATGTTVWRIGEGRESAWEGQIAELAVWGVGLSANDVKLLYAGGIVHPMPLAVGPSKPEAYWSLNEKSDGAVVGSTDVRDWSGNGHHSTTSGNGPVFKADPRSHLGVGPLIGQAPAVVVALLLLQANKRGNKALNRLGGKQ